MDTHCLHADMADIWWSSSKRICMRVLKLFHILFSGEKKTLYPVAWLEERINVVMCCLHKPLFCLHKQRWRNFLWWIDHNAVSSNHWKKLVILIVFCVSIFIYFTFSAAVGFLCWRKFSLLKRRKRWWWPCVMDACTSELIDSIWRVKTIICVLRATFLGEKEEPIFIIVILHDILLKSGK